MERKNAIRIVTILLLWLSSTAKADLVVAVLDSGFDPNLSQAPICKISDVVKDGHDLHHGTAMADTIAQYAGTKGYCILPIPVISKDKQIIDYLGALSVLTSLKVDVINLSITGPELNILETALLKKLLDKGVTIFAAAGNEGKVLDKDACTVFPACADPRIVVVGAVYEKSNFGTRVNKVMPEYLHCLRSGCLQGTSISTAIETGKFVKYLMEKSK